MEPIINKIKSQFIKITKIEIGESHLILEMLDKIKLLLPYYNTALEFYLDEFYWLNITNDCFIVFGHDLTGYYMMNKNDGRILKVNEYDESLTLRFCNSDINKFVCFNNLFFNCVMKRISNEITIDLVENYSETLNRIFISIDERGMSEENNFWTESLYELSEAFFPLTDVHIKLIEELQIH